MLWKANKIVCCVRNPADTVASLMHFFPTLIQSGQINEKFQDFPDVFDRLVKETTTALDIYHSAVLKEMVPTVPTYFIRYEDLRMEPERVLSELFCFILDVKSIEGLNI